MSTRSLLAGYTAHVWKNIKLRIYPDPFCILCHIYTINKKPRLNTPLNTKTPLKWVFMYIIPDISSKNLTRDTIFSNYLLVVDAYSKIPKLYGMENINTEEVIDKLYMFQSIF